MNLQKMARSGHQKNSPSIPASPDLFDHAREREQVRNLAVSKLARRHGFPVATAALVARLSGLGGAQHG